ncbi:MAG: hypothetical protein ACRDSR_23290 [Pseudonocardiaceae bacterium]
MTEDHIELLREFPDNVIIRGNSVYFAVGDAGRVVDFCRMRGWAVVGLEGLHLDRGTVVADMNLIADFSEEDDQDDWSRYVQACAAEAERVLVEWAGNSELLVEVVVLTCPDGPP